MNNASLVLLDETLNYLNGNKIDEVQLMGAMVEQEATQFLNLNVNFGIDIVAEGARFEKIKEGAINLIKKAIDAIVRFIKWLKDTVVKFFSTLFKKIKNRKPLKQQLEEFKNKKKNVSESVDILNESDSVTCTLDKFLALPTLVPVDLCPPKKFQKSTEDLINWAANPSEVSDFISDEIERIAEDCNYDTTKFYDEYFSSRNTLIPTLIEDMIRYSNFFNHSRDLVSFDSFINKQYDKEYKDYARYCENYGVESAIKGLEITKKEYEENLKEIQKINEEDTDATSTDSLLDMLNKKQEPDKISKRIRRINFRIQILTCMQTIRKRYLGLYEKSISIAEHYFKTDTVSDYNLVKMLDDKPKDRKLVAAVTPAVAVAH